jgi:sulfur relay (sulfurtransferase) complex TusBCD TusD component (DsrE family)
MKSLFILNDPPYGSERCYNGLRIAHALLKRDPQIEVAVFLMADSVVAAEPDCIDRTPTVGARAAAPDWRTA